MKIFFLLIFFTIAIVQAKAQVTDVATFQETAASFTKKGDYDNAILVLNKALSLEPGNKAVLKDILFTSFLKRDFAKARDIGETLIKRPDADAQTYQMLGSTYNAIAENKEAEKLYKNGIKKFPNEGVMYAEYGKLLSDKNTDDALKLFEKGIEADANHSSNYYYVAKLYAQKGEILWSLLFGEMFINIESFSGRSTEIKNLLLDQYKQFYLTAPDKTYSQSKATDFTKMVAKVLSDQQQQAIFGLTPESLTAIRTRFVLTWYYSNAKQYPFRLFDQQRQLLREGLFDAYNQWLFGPPSNLASYQLWQKYHINDFNEYMAFVKSKIFKIPEGQQYKVF